MWCSQILTGRWGPHPSALEKQGGQGQADLWVWPPWVPGAVGAAVGPSVVGGLLSPHALPKGHPTSLPTAGNWNV